MADRSCKRSRFDPDWLLPLVRSTLAQRHESIVKRFALSSQDNHRVAPRAANGGCRSWLGALIALPTKALNFEEHRGHGQHESIQNGVRKRLPALHHQGGEEGSYEGGGACHHPLANGL